ncbi:MAG: aminotransferase class IV [Planctomycetota bacterium]|nr:aminotransferase class IV [Planctomycetota bacterium]
MTRLCNLDGEIRLEHEAQVSVLDRGFLFGDSVYEVMRTRSGVPFGWPEHLDRLRASATGIGLPLDLTNEEILQRIKTTLASADHGESYVRIIATRGTATAPNIDLSFAPGPLTWVILVRELPPAPSGFAHLAIVPRLRMDPRALDPAIKSGNYLNNLLGLAEARKRGATDCLFLNHEGEVTEASTSNFYVIRGSKISTPPLRAGLLSGITRLLLFEFAQEAGVHLVEEDLREEDVRNAEELFLSSSLRDVFPVAILDGQAIGNGKPGPVTNSVIQGFAQFCDRRTREVYGPGFANI